MRVGITLLALAICLVGISGRDILGDSYLEDIERDATYYGHPGLSNVHGGFKGPYQYSSFKVPVSNSYHYRGAYYPKIDYKKLDKIATDTFNTQFDLARTVSADIDYFYNRIKAILTARRYNRPLLGVKQNETFRYYMNTIRPSSPQQEEDNAPYQPASAVFIPVPVYTDLHKSNEITNKIHVLGNHYYYIKNRAANVDNYINYFNSTCMNVRTEALAAFKHAISLAPYLPKTLEELLYNIEKAREEQKRKESPSN